MCIYVTCLLMLVKMGETSSIWIIIPDLEGKQRTFAASKQNKEMILVTSSNCED